jgi:hypothetical protein
MIFLRGVGRLISILLIGLPPIPFIGFRSWKSWARRSSSYGRHASRGRIIAQASWNGWRKSNPGIPSNRSRSSLDQGAVLTAKSVNHETSFSRVMCPCMDVSHGPTSRAGKCAGVPGCCAEGTQLMSPETPALVGQLLLSPRKA